MSHNEFNDIIDSQLNSKGNDDLRMIKYEVLSIGY